MEQITITETKKLSEQFESYVKEHGISYTHIHRKTNLSVPYVRQMLLNINPISEKNRQKINEALGTNF